MNKTIYVKDEDVATWDRAKELAGDKLAPIIASALKRYVAEKEAEARGYDRIEVSYSDELSNGLPRRKAFFGRWVFPPDEPERSPFHDGEACCAVAITAKGAVVTLSWLESFEGRSYRRFQVHDSFESGAEESACAWAVIAAWEKVGVPVEELDI